MNVYFLFPWCRTSLPLDFPSVLVVRGGAVCLPTPPSWFSRQCLFSSSYKAGILDMNSLFLSTWECLFVYLYFRKIALLDIGFSVDGFISFSTLNVVFLPVPSTVSAETSAVNLLVVPCTDESLFCSCLQKFLAVFGFPHFYDKACRCETPCIYPA